MKKKGIVASTKIVILTLLFVKIIGFIKQAVIAAYFGTDGKIDKFLLVSDFMENLGVALFSAIAVSFLTMYIESKTDKGKNASDVMFSNIMVLCIPVIIIAILVIFLLSEQLAQIIAPGYKEEDIIIVSQYIKLFSVTILNMFIFYLSNAVLEAEKVFFPGKIVGVIRSICIIFSIVFLANSIGISSLLIGTMVYYFIESCFILICVKRYIKFHICRPYKDSSFFKLLKLGVPLFISYGTLELQTMVDKAIASGLVEGSISILTYGSYLYSTTHSIIIGGLCSVVFSYFTTYVNKCEREILLSTLYKCIQVLIIILLFVSIIYIFYSEEIVSIVYERGEFDQTSTQNVALAFTAYSVGLVFIAIRDIIIRAHYAHQNNKQAMINGVLGVAINIIMSILLSRFMGFTGIALATSISSICICVYSCNTIKKDIPEFRISKLSKGIFKILIAGIMTIAYIILSEKLFVFANSIILTLLCNCVICLIIYIGCLYIFKDNEVKVIIDMVINKALKNKRK